MKNTNYIINAILGAAVIALFVLHFTGDKDATSASAAASTNSATVVSSGTIAYFKVDSVMANWDLYYSVQEELAKKQTELETDFNSKSEDFMKRMEDAQYKTQRGLVTRAEAQELQQQLGAEQQNLVNLEQSYALQLQEEGLVKNRQMIDQLEQFLAKYNETKGYSYIFSYAFGGNLLYGDDALDITAEVIEGINAAYPAEKE